MIVLGLTGSIGMGKSTVAEMFRQQDIPVHEADQEVHHLLGPRGEAVRKVVDAFPDDDIYMQESDEIDRGALAAVVFYSEDALHRLEGILHPMVREAQKSFILAARSEGHDIVVLDVPLLFETGADKSVDYTVVVSAPFNVQEQRVLARSGMTRDKFHAILATQLPDEVKRSRADYVISTGFSRATTKKEVEKLIKELRSK